jgi:hypothetical protein
VISGKREMSLQLAMKLESFFSLSDGELMQMQALQSIKQRKHDIKNHLCEQLVAKNAFWSYDVKSHEEIPDEELIEKCFTVLDLDDIDLTQISLNLEMETKASLLYRNNNYSTEERAHSGSHDYKGLCFYESDEWLSYVKEQANVNDNKIYLLANSSGQTNNVFDEYIWINNSWEYLGHKHVTLSDYYTKQEVNNLIQNLQNQINNLRNG